MALSKVAKDLKDLLTCAICLEDFTDRDPRVLYCQHSFCMPCLEAQYNTEVAKHPHHSNSILCITCNSVTRLTRGSIFTLRSYFLAQRVSNTLQRISNGRSPDEDMTCTKCKQDPDIVSYCFDCVHVMCMSCHRFHVKKHKQHIKVSINRHNIRSLKCRAHYSFAEDFCLDCKLVACSVCHSTVHRGHTFANFTLPSKEIEKASEKLQNPAYVDAHSLRKVIDKEIQTTADEIEKHTQKIISFIIEKATVMKSDIRASFQEAEEKMKQADTMKKNMATTHLSPEWIIRPLPDIPGLSLDCNSPLANDWINTTAGCHYQPLKFVPDKGFLDNLHLGWLIPGEPVQPDEVEMDPTDEQPLIASGVPRIRWDKQDVTLGSVDFLPDGNIIAIGQGKDNFNQLYMFDIDGNEWPVPFNTSRLGNISKLSVHKPSNTIALIPRETRSSWNNNSKITLINTKPETWIVTATYVDLMPIDVAFDPDGQLVFVTEDNKLVKCSNNGQEVWKVELGPQCVSPCLHISQDGRVFVRFDLASLTIYDRDGTMLGRLPRRNDRQVSHLSGFCTDSQGNVYIADSTQKDVLCMYNKHGTYVKEVMTDLEKNDSIGIDLVVYNDQFLLAVGIYDRCTSTTLFRFDVM